VKLVLSVEALSLEPTGIGRYVWELAQRLPLHPLLDDVRFYRNGLWVKDPHSLVQAAVPPSPKTSHFRFKLPRSLRDWHIRFACKGRIFHGPNFFLPVCADVGVITVHDLSVFKFPETHPIERVRQFERDFARSLKQSAHVITDSQTTRNEVIAFTGLPASQVTSVALGVSEIYRPKDAKDLVNPLHKYGVSPGNYVLCVSTLEPRKKIDRLLAAWRQMPASLRLQFPLVLVGGKGWLNQTLHEEISHGESQGWIKRLGYVSEQDLPLLYAGAAVFVYPSTYEGFGLPPIEAMSCGVPVVVSNQSCLPEVTQGAALMVDPDDAAAFSSALEKSLTDVPWRQTAITAGHKVAASYTWENCTNETVAVYQKIAAGE
jgi:glycosyltransferase involved in cell wall biosynthesis